MNNKYRKIYAAIVGSPAPRQLEWVKFERFWEGVADRVENESGDRLAVDFHGHREVFRRPQSGQVGIEDIERARHLLKAAPDRKGHGEIAAVVIDAEQARILVFDLDSAKVDDTEHTVRDGDPRARRLRTVEKKTGRDDEHDLTHYFDDLAAAIAEDAPGLPFVICGHGAGKSDVAAGFAQRLATRHAELAEHAAGTARIDISAADDAAIEAAAIAALHEHVNAPETT
ncbi:hypothetical protein [Tsukamurella sp. PLM1]|uniref:hypothetical protein n=1 Tax=Tsukamurella sp. PLM1 TaxID=2929795 RepID=UPI0020706C90|nr:hypothetical protein [Tsukamurella sp. PLM1]BDH57309.1 hypothetical protein MTP03_22480 [Tsukamurella sp. PLM1]